MPLSKLSLATRLAAQYHRPTLYEIIQALEQRINVVLDGYLFRVTSVSANYTATIQDSVILVDASGGNRTITLPRADACKEKRFTIKKKDGGSNTVTVQSSGGTIDDGATYVFDQPYASVCVVSDGSEFWIV